MRLLLSIVFITILCVNNSFSHEAWILTHNEVVNLSKKEAPELFLNKYILFSVFLISYFLIYSLILFEKYILNYENKIFQNVKIYSKSFGPMILRWGIAINIGLGAMGALPRHGVKLWSSPTLFVPDMQLNLLTGDWQWLSILCIGLSLFLCLGLFSRWVSLLVIVLSFYSVFLFGERFMMYYALHFIAPALIIMYYGGGKLALDGLFKIQTNKLIHLSEEKFWKIIQLMAGFTFVALAVGVKLLQPTLIIAILEHAGLSFFGIPTPIAALIMMLIELLAGLLLAFGFYVRPIAAFLIGAFTFFAIVLGETPLFHANLYALMFVFLLRGGSRLSFIGYFQKIHFPKWKHKNA